MNAFLKSNKNKDCCGCSACVAACPKNCIEMKKDAEGFAYPYFVNIEMCINCKVCTDVCPMETKTTPPENIYAYAGYSNNANVISQTSSGGIFPVIAKKILSNGGVIYGAAFDDKHILSHIRVDSERDLVLLYGSKYIQSNTNGIFEKCKKDLEQNLTVLFTGTPCQVYALKKYLKTDYDKLFTVDVICHGVPSQHMFDSYVAFLERKHNAKLIDINFRDKTKNGWSITLRYTMQYKNGKTKNYFLISPLSEYFAGFLGGYILRESCYRCPFSSLERPADITLGDFWGYQKTRPELKHNEGLSVLTANSDKGKRMVESLYDADTFITEVSRASLEKSENKNLFAPTQRRPERDVIYSELESQGFEYIAKTYLQKGHTLKNKIKNLIPKKLIDIIKIR